MKHTLKQMRLEKKLTATEAAHRANVSYPSLMKWEKGDVVPNVIVIHNLLKVYDYKFENLDLGAFEKTQAKKQYSQFNKNEPLVKI